MQFHHCAGFALALALPLAAQEPTAPSPSQISFRVPVHTAPLDPVGGVYGVWAAGDDYKVSFDEGFTFYPSLGANEPEHMPLRWRSTSFVVGGEPLVLGSKSSWEGFRFERAHGRDIVEAYDVLDVGVEQTFTLTKPLPRSGDLEIVGDIGGPLTTPVTEIDRGEIVFTDFAGRPTVGYGAAVVFDSTGRHGSVSTMFDGARIRLVVDGQFLAGATYPVTIDPIVRNIRVVNAAERLHEVDIVRDDESNKLFVVCTRTATGSDRDAFGYFLNDALTTYQNVWADVQSSWSVLDPEVAFVGGANKFAVAMTRDFEADGSTRVRVYLHGNNDTTVNSGQLLYLHPPAGQQDATPTIGGTPGFDSQPYAYLAWRRDSGSTGTNGSTSWLRGCRVNCLNGTFSDERSLAGNGTVDAEAPSLTRTNDGATTGWLVVWQEHANTPGAYWRIFARQVRHDGTITGHTGLGFNGAGDQNVHPQIAGTDGRYLVSWVDRRTTIKDNITWGHRVRTRRMDWPQNGTATIGSYHDVVSHSSSLGVRTDRGRSLDVDSRTKSIWIVGWEDNVAGVHAARVGHDGLSVETVEIHAKTQSATPYAPSVCFDDDASRFVFGYLSDASSYELRAAAYEYPADLPTTFGTGCAGNINGDTRVADDRFVAGDDEVKVVLTGGQPSALTLLFASVGPAPVPLPLPLSQGCDLLLNPDVLIQAGAGSTSAVGAFSAQFRLLSFTRGIDLYWQFLQVGPTSISSTSGLVTPIR